MIQAHQLISFPVTGIDTAREGRNMRWKEVGESEERKSQEKTGGKERKRERYSVNQNGERESKKRRIKIEIRKKRKKGRDRERRREKGKEIERQKF